MSSENTLPNGLPADDFTLDLEPAEASSSLPFEAILSAADIKEIYESLAGFTKSELKRIPIVPEGGRLEPGATYLDLADLSCGPFVASGEMVAQFDHYYVPKARVDYLLWNRLTGVTNPARLDQPDRG